MRYSGAEVVGKYSNFAYLPGRDETLLRRPGQENRFVAGMPPGATLVFSRNVWRRVGFPDRPRKVDLYFVEGARAAGFEVFSSEPWEFCHIRHTGEHTWLVDESMLADGAEIAWQGLHPSRSEA